MRVLVACEYSGAVRSALRAVGVDAWSCDLVAAEDGSEFHYRGDVFTVADRLGPWHAVLGFPPCTDLAASGARWWAGKGEDRRDAAVAFARDVFALAPVAAIENPVGRLSSLWRMPDQTFQPWQFGDLETKRTCLWLSNLPPLLPTHGSLAPGVKPLPRVHMMPPGPDRARERSRTLSGFARAIADQWGPLLR